MHHLTLDYEFTRKKVWSRTFHFIVFNFSTKLKFWFVNRKVIVTKVTKSFKLIANHKKNIDNKFKNKLLSLTKNNLYSLLAIFYPNTTASVIWGQIKNFTIKFFHARHQTRQSKNDLSYNYCCDNGECKMIVTLTWKFTYSKHIQITNVFGIFESE